MSDPLRLSAGVQWLAAAAGEDAPRVPRFAMAGYTGGLIRQGWSREPVVIDLAGMTIPAAVPIVAEHDYRIGAVLGQGVARVEGGELLLDGEILAQTDTAAQVVALGDRGYQWQASVGADVESHEVVPAGNTVTVNGRSFEGPVRVVRGSLLRELSILTLGADAATAVTITAGTAEEKPMTDDKQMSAEDMPTGMAAEEHGDMPTGPVESAAPTVDLKAIRDQIVIEVKNDLLKEIRASRGPAIHAGTTKPAVDDKKVMQAALCMSGGLPGVEKSFAEPVLEAAHKAHRGIGLQDVLLIAARSNGYQGPSRIRESGTLREVLKAAYSTGDIADILAATYGKFLLQGFTSVEAVWDRISVVRPVSDFKTITGVRLDGGFVYDEVGNDGKIKHADPSDDKRTLKAKTYARMSSLTRQDIINDDLGALTQVPQRLGRGGALKLNDVFWTEFLANNATAYEAKAAAAGNALSLTSLKDAVGLYRKLKDPDGNPLGITPAILLVPPELEITAAELMGSSLIHGTSGAAPSTNVLAGRYQVVSSAYLTSATTWWLCASPADLPSMEVGFLNGQRTPTVEQAEASFDTLGIEMRGYFDFGVSKGDKRAAYRMATA